MKEPSTVCIEQHSIGTPIDGSVYLDISSPKEDVLVNFVASRNLHSVFLPPFGPKGPHYKTRN
jgi:hypothetical protein